MLAAVPWIGVAMVAYSIVVFGLSAPGLAGATALLSSPLVSLPLMSGVRWSMNVGDAIVLFTLAMLFIELLKAVRRRGNSITDHALSTLVLIVAFIMFLMVEKAATSVFFVIAAAALIDVISGFFITIRASRRDIGPGHGAQN